MKECREQWIFLDFVVNRTARRGEWWWGEGKRSDGSGRTLGTLIN